MELVGTAVSTILVGLLTMWAAVGGAAGLVVWLPSENLELGGQGPRAGGPAVDEAQFVVCG